jgi:epoxyqueuosine reductase
MISADQIKREIQERSSAEGFDIVGFADPDIGHRSGELLETFIERGHHGDMGWLETHADRRKSPRSLWPEVETVIVLGANYGPDHLPHERLDELKENSQANISVYARNRDYHDVMKKRLKRIGRWMCDTFDCDVKVFVDTAPVLEKPIAQQAGIGWQGKHTNLVSREFGSWLFLSEIYTTLKLLPDTSEPDRCGTCRKCLDICPTNAFIAPYQLDARKCISYLTIEHKGHIAAELRAAIGTRIYGCDDCLSVCPWNKFAQPTNEPAFLPRDNLDGPAISSLLRLDDEEFRQIFSKSPVKRTGRDRVVRNALIAAGNTGDHSLAGEVARLLNDDSPLVRAMAVWAFSRLSDISEFNDLRERHQPGEQDEDVLKEWRTATSPVD